MGAIFIATLYKLLNPRKVIIYLLAVSLVSALAALLIKYLFGSSNLQGQIITYTSFFVGLSFFWILGLPLVLWICWQGVGLIAGEKEEGTLLLLLSKPLTRKQILWAKLLALLLSAPLLGECTLFLSLMSMTLFIFPDDQITFMILKYFPYLSLYLLFITVCYSILSTGLSVWNKPRKKIRGGLLCLILILYLILPGLRLIAEYILHIPIEYSWGNWLIYFSYLDLNTHLYTVFAYFLNLAGSVSLSPVLAIEPLLSPFVILVIWLAACLLFLNIALRYFDNLEILS
ncbi:MAG TPA: ABC transporter permease subunit [Peptococcaceae bacterium]|nr:ABC transporter permease subunit [Peptococcaceae bacterium]